MNHPQCPKPRAPEAESNRPLRRNHRLSMFGRSVKLPERQWLRLSIGAVLVIGGLMGFMPVLGVWMLPLGIAVLSIDIPVVRRYSRRSVRWLRRRYPSVAARVFPRKR